AIIIGVTCGVAFLLLMTISSGIVLAVQNIYARGDMDLLLSSPLAPRTLVVVRGLAIAATLCGGACALILPFAHLLALFVTAKWLLTYAALVWVALLGTGISLTRTRPVSAARPAPHPRVCASARCAARRRRAAARPNSQSDVGKLAAARHRWLLGNGQA